MTVYPLDLLPGPPSTWIPRGGKPATCLGSRATPSYVHEDDKTYVLDFLVAYADKTHLRLIPWSYDRVSVLSTEDLACLHSGPEAWHAWRPQLYQKMMIGWNRLGSQTELAWRQSLHDVFCGETEHKEINLILRELKARQAEDRAEENLLAYLTPFQQLDYLLSLRNSFRVRGAATDNVYEVDLGDGFFLLDKTTMDPIVSYCFHPEEWIPAPDVALATKFCLEDPELEVDVLENAHFNLRERPRQSNSGDLVARRLERDLLPRRPAKALVMPTDRYSERKRR